MILCPTTIDPTGVTDVTDHLNRWLTNTPIHDDPDRTLQLQPGAKYLCNGTIEMIRLNGGALPFTLDFNSARLVRTVTTTGRNDSMLRVFGHNMTIKDVHVVGPMGAMVYDADIEGQHGVEVSNGSTGLHFTGTTTCTGIYGDGIYVGAVSGPDPWGLTDGVIVDCPFLWRMGRQGMSVCMGHNVTIGSQAARGSISGTCHSAIDLEPDTANGDVQNVTITDIDTKNIHLNTFSSKGMGQVDGVSLARISTWEPLKVSMEPPKGTRRSNFSMVDCGCVSGWSYSGPWAPVVVYNVDGVTVTGCHTVCVPGFPSAGGIWTSGSTNVTLSGNKWRKPRKPLEAPADAID